jgi:hypothetical protein
MRNLVILPPSELHALRVGEGILLHQSDSFGERQAYYSTLHDGVIPGGGGTGKAGPAQAQRGEEVEIQGDTTPPPTSTE